ncbi:arginine/serine-rich coiled-coil protein 2-like isoform X2 [Physella acuta]|uniref:arginine/serine-rich coiled-coil protein 2-like isoform X2 n=1 Tax=Physella acuta TaxID=109671 RepID=UPI0027DDFB3E|nr:arginine/serine-rich coiled-coil protein 2-like isoform X2 [Physella acuta]
MDLLANYDDEISNTSNRSTNGEQVFSQKIENTGRLQSEWENFEKMIGTSPTSGLGDSCEMTQPKISNSNDIDNRISTTVVLQEALSNHDADEDESHLPPGVRKKNRCHSSSSSSSEEEDNKRRKSHSVSDMSCSDSEDSDKVTKKTSKNEEKQSDNKESEKSAPKSETLEKNLDKKVKHRSTSRSRSRSPHSKKRRSSERSRHSRSRSRSRSRHHRKEKKHRSHRSRSRSKERRKSKDRDYPRRHREHRHSRSRSRERRERRRDVKGRDSDRSRRSRSRSRGRRRSPSPRGSKVIKYGDKYIKAGASFGRPPPSKPMTFKEKMRQQLIKAMEEGDGTILCTQTAGTQQAPAPKKPPVPLMANIVTSTAGLTAATITASEAAMQSLLALQKETTEKTGIEIPKYYNPAAINPVKYAEQVQKRKLLWSKNKEKEVNSQWHATTLSSDHDNKSKEKFRKLMGIKNEAGSSADDDEKASEELELKQKELFEKLDKEYQYARMATHTHRGVGLGFGSSAYPPPGT